MMRFSTGLAAASVLMLAGSAWAQEAAPSASAPAVVASEWRTVAPENLLVIDTNKGRILVELAPEVAPGHVERIRLLAGRGFYDNQVWHRVIDQFMAQTGDPLGTGEGQSAYPDLKAEFTFRRDGQTPFAAVAAPAGAVLGFLHSLPVQTQPDAYMATTADRKVHAWGLYCPGVAGMARDEAPDSANSQFFLMRQPYPSLDKRYTIWGRVVSGLDVVRALKFSSNPDGIVTGPDQMKRVMAASDLPPAERPTVRVLDTASPQFRALADAARQAKGADFSVCDIDLPVQVAGAPAA
ncbi:peptidylprolyl isomerase [Brevundimonas sp.]|uniref:peptidylprolyl isomerase n=1 Tax=Brevundimonas sp. TaxID=1871086 RepID=UPI0028B052F8|nr:peptidylprolyl isomerase [Brevundimonas sp.]